MPGRTPHGAYRAFVEPLGAALSCVLRAKIICTAGGQKDLGRVHQLLIGYDPTGDGYLKLKGGRGQLEMRARMKYEIILCEDQSVGKYRVTTRAYDYSVRRQDKTVVVDYHWHPESKVNRPHAHIGSSELAPDGVLTNKDHLFGGRMTFESVVRTLISELEVAPLCDDWEAVLDRAELPHLKHRTWHQSPPRDELAVPK